MISLYKSFSDLLSLWQTYFPRFIEFSSRVKMIMSTVRYDLQFSGYVVIGQHLGLSFLKTYGMIGKSLHKSLHLGQFHGQLVPLRSVQKTEASCRKAAYIKRNPAPPVPISSSILMMCQIESRSPLAIETFPFPHPSCQVRNAFAPNMGNGICNISEHVLNVAFLSFGRPGVCIFQVPDIVHTAFGRTCSRGEPNFLQIFG